MATQISSKPDKKAPITRHPLFPAVVAMWFGSLFGLGSLAVRASLIESLVLQLSLDVLLPAAAPPLGLKFRIILALLLAAIGIAVGAALARRIARPRRVAVPRRRGVGGRAAARQARAAVAASAGAPADMPARRRPLAVTEEERVENYELAPLPGGAPAILDVTQIDISMTQEESQASFGAGHAVDAPLELASYADGASHGTGPVHPAPQTEPARFESARFEPVTFEPVAFEPVPVEQTPPAAFTPAAEPEADAGRQVFRAAAPSLEPEPVAEIAQSAPANFHRPFEAAATVAPAAEGPQTQALDFARPFDAVAQAPVAAETPAVAPLDLMAADELGGEPAGLDEAPESEYARMMSDLRKVDDDIAAAGQFAPPLWSDEPPAAIDGLATQATAADFRPEPEVGSDAPQEPAPPVHHPIAQTPLSSRIETAPLAELSPVELIERLALAMRQRTHLIALPGELVEAVSALARPAGEAAPLVQAMPAAEAAAPAQELPAFAPPVAPAPIPSFAPPPGMAEPVEEPVAVEAPAAPAEKRVELPAALRPIDLSDFAEHDDLGDLPLPPRSFGAPQAATPQFAPPAAAESETAKPETPQPVAPGVAEIEPEPDVLEEGYSSLLDLVRPAAPRNDFVRIEEPETESDEIEPVVLFPGHAARPGTRFAAPGAVAASQPAGDSAALDEVADEFGMPQLRRFDAPAKIASPVANGATAPADNPLRQDPEEAQRALRAALATLQRMSGAA